jgi:hypothetical protein
MTSTLPPAVLAVDTVRRKPIERARVFGTTPEFIPELCERITRDWLRGVSERALSVIYRVTREAGCPICGGVGVRVCACLTGAAYRPCVCTERTRIAA